MILSEKIQELSEIWGEIIGCSHHKNCDIRHFITQEYSFGNLIYKVEHSAYIGENICQTRNTERAAQEYLCRELIRQIEDQIIFNISRCNDPADESEMPLEYWLELKKKFDKSRNIECSDSPAQVNYEELFFDIKQKHESQNYHLKELDRILDFHNIDKCSGEYPELEYSVNYRVEMLVEKLRNK